MKIAHFSDRLLSAMELKGINKLQLSKLVGSSHTTVGRWLETNGFVPRAKTAHKVAGELGINARWLLHGEGEMNSAASTNKPKNDLSAVKMVPVFLWSVATEVVSCDEMLKSSSTTLPCICDSDRAFALVYEGDSMKPLCLPKDILVIDPDAALRSGCLVVAKLRDDGITLRRYAKIDEERAMLIPYNTLYPSVEYSLKDFHWIYPVHSTIRQEF